MIAGLFWLWPLVYVGGAVSVAVVAFFVGLYLGLDEGRAQAARAARERAAEPEVTYQWKRVRWEGGHLVSENIEGATNRWPPEVVVQGGDMIRRDVTAMPPEPR